MEYSTGCNVSPPQGAVDTCSTMVLSMCSMEILTLVPGASPFPSFCHSQCCFSPPLPVQHFCTFLNMLSQQHHEPNSCTPLQTGVGLWQSWLSLSLAQGSHNSFSQMLQPSPTTKTLPCKPKNQAFQVWKCQI